MKRRYIVDITEDNAWFATVRRSAMWPRSANVEAGQSQYCETVNGMCGM